jgi:hypothetical protein
MFPGSSGCFAGRVMEFAGAAASRLQSSSQDAIPLIFRRMSERWFVEGSFTQSLQGAADISIQLVKE